MKCMDMMITLHISYMIGIGKMYRIQIVLTSIIVGFLTVFAIALLNVRRCINTVEVND